MVQVGYVEDDTGRLPQAKQGVEQRDRVGPAGDRNDQEGVPSDESPSAKGAPELPFDGG
jgi:hypothetical protein